MQKRKLTKLIHEGQYAAEVDVEIIDSNMGWAPYLSLDDAMKLDDVREALRHGDIKRAEKKATVYHLTRLHAA